MSITVLRRVENEQHAQGDGSGYMYMRACQRAVQGPKLPLSANFIAIGRANPLLGFGRPACIQHSLVRSVPGPKTNLIQATDHELAASIGHHTPCKRFTGPHQYSGQALRCHHLAKDKSGLTL